ncbi:MAG: SurA N-terminal domain-containing protein [Thiomicrorhabdus sp.]|jgi:peptidyl-prolyl cis-trans isomerase D|nr:SurA N-terminal domain-containing protein [Thiomicrorhabdus sp.]
MLQSIRSHAQGWVAWVIVGLIILTFALFGIDQYARGDKVVVVAEVNGENITGNDFMTLYSRQKSRLQEQFGDMYDQVVKDQELRGQVLDSLVESEVMRQWANDNGMRIGNQHLASAIHAASVFQQDGQFSEKIYEDVLMRNGLNVARFEYEQRQFLLENQFRSLINSSRFATDYEVNQLADLQGQEREVSYLRIDQRPFLKTVQVTDEQVSAVYQANLTDYVEPEKVSVDYIDLSQEAIAKGIEVNDEIIAAYYETNKSLFTLPEERHAKHILISLEADTDKAEAAAQVILAEVQAKIAAGEKFEELAKIYSKDPGSASSGGDLGSFSQGMMVPEFDEAVFSMEVGQVSEPIKTDFGYHLIKLVGISAKQAQPFEDVKAEVTQQYKMQEAERQYFELLEQLNTIVYEQTDSLEPAADAIGLKVQTSEVFSRSGGPGEILSNPKVQLSAFSNELLNEHLNSAAIEISATRSVAVRVNEHQEQRQKSLSEVSAGIKAQLVREAAVKEAATLGQAIMAKVEAGENPESLMENGIEWNTAGWITRNTKTLLPQMVTEVFKVTKPESGKKSWGSFQLTTGDTVLLRVSAVRVAPLDDEQKVPLKAAFNELFANAQNAAHLKALVAKAEVIKKPLYETIK